MIWVQLSAGRKDAAEILEAGDSLSLRVCGNSSHLAPWHAKLGFQRDPLVATLGSLTADGGVASVLDVVIEKVSPRFNNDLSDVDGAYSFHCGVGVPSRVPRVH